MSLVIRSIPAKRCASMSKTAPERHRRKVFSARDFGPGDVRQGPVRPQLHLRHRRACPMQGVVLKGGPGRSRRIPPSSRRPTGSRSSCAATSAGSRIVMAPARHARARGRGRGRLHRVRAAATRKRSRVDNPPVVAETRVDIPEASVSDAVMLLDLRNTNALAVPQQRHGHVQHGLPTRRRHDRLGRAAARLSPTSTGVSAWLFASTRRAARLRTGAS